MSVLWESFSTGLDGYYEACGTWWCAQTFTPLIPHTITSVKLRMYRRNSPGTLTVSIRTTSAGKPTTTVLCSGTINGNTLTTNTAGAWYEITLGAGASLSAGVQYAIVLQALGGDTKSNKVRWIADCTDATYTGGTVVITTNSGVLWVIQTACDHAFETWGDSLATDLTAVDSGSGVESKLISSTRSRTDTGTGTDAKKSFLAALSRPETGAGLDVNVVRGYTLRGTDLGVGVDHYKLRRTGEWATLLAEHTREDSGIAVEQTINFFYNLSCLDTGAGVDSASLLATLVRYESAVGVEKLGDLWRLFEDSGHGVDYVSNFSESIIKQSQDTGLGIEVIISRLLAARDTGLGTEAANALHRMRILHLAVITAQHQDVKTVAAQYRLINALLTQKRKLEGIAAQHQKVEPITTQERKVETLTGG